VSRHAVVTAQASGLIACHHCGLVVDAEPGQICPRCLTRLKERKPDSLARTWALLLASVILYIPANVLPIMVTTSLMGTQRDTILSGVIYFWTSGSQGLALLIFTVSVLVPLLKLGTLAFLATSIHLRSSRSVHQRAKLFRIVELVGRWSMLDVFVVALMVGLVRFSNLAIIEAGPGAAKFGGVVVLTMLAAHSFDPRLIWDSSETDDD